MPGNPLTDPQWAPNLADTIERVVGNIRDKTTKPLLVAYRAVMFGLIAAFGGLVALVLLVIALSRALQELIGLGVDHHNAVWISYLGLGALFSFGGLFAMKRRFPTEVNPA